MRSLPTVSVVLMAALSVLIATQTGCRDENSSLEQIALDEFVSRYWGPEMFVGECTGLPFSPRSPLDVFTSNSGFSISLLDIPGFAGVDLKAAVVEEGGLDRLESLARPSIEFGPIDLGAYSFARVAKTGRPKEDWSPPDPYLLRFSNRLRFREKVYLEIWIKADRASSGARVDFEFDERTEQLLRSRKQQRRCDDWG